MATLDRGLLAFLERRKTEVPPPVELPSRLPLDAIKRHESLFQPRALNPRHVTALASVLRSQADLSPMLVIQIGPDAVLIDGHHRRAAYEEAGGREAVPVTYFDGTVADAIVQSGVENHMDKLAMSSVEKRDFAWRLVLMDKHSKAVQAASSGSSPRTVARMRAVKRQLEEQGVDPFRFSSWTAADMAARGDDRDWSGLSDDELEERLDEQAVKYLDRLRKAFADQLADPNLAARVLVAYMGESAIPDLIHALMGRVGLTHRRMIEAGLIESSDDPHYEPTAATSSAEF